MMSKGWSLLVQRRPEKEPPKYSPNRSNPSRQRHPGSNAATQARQSHVNWFDERFTPKWPLVDCVTWTLHGCTAEQSNSLARTSAQLGRTCSHRSL